MKVLHITNDFAGSKVYMNLVLELDSLGVEQIVYTPVKAKHSIGENRINFKTKGSELLYANILNKTFDRVFYRKKIRKIYRSICSKVDMAQIDLIHAHTWYSDGGVAHLLAKEFNIPYIVTIRNSDLNVFQKYLFHERSFGRLILADAKEVVLISAAYKDRLLALDSLQSIRSRLSKKLHIIPNGVDHYWIENVNYNNRKSITNQSINLLYVGKFSKGKNVHLLQKAVNNLNEKQEKLIHLHLIGGGGGMEQQVLRTLKLHEGTMTYHGKIYDCDALRTHYEQADAFVMPSKNETFGLVYVEAMLQGLPVLYTKNEGIDGFYSNSIGEKIHNFSLKEIKSKLLTLMHNLDDYSIPQDKLVQNHNWINIAKKYNDLYISI